MYEVIVPRAWKIALNTDRPLDPSREYLLSATPTGVGRDAFGSVVHQDHNLALAALRQVGAATGCEVGIGSFAHHLVVPGDKVQSVALRLADELRKDAPTKVLIP